MKPVVVMALAGAALGVGGILVVADTGSTLVSSRSGADVANVANQAAIAERTVTLRVNNMFCASCPYIVQRTLASTPGVIAASVSFRDKLAVVTYDNAQTDVLALTNATSEIGYPSEVISQ